MYPHLIKKVPSNHTLGRLVAKVVLKTFKFLYHKSFQAECINPFRKSGVCKKALSKDNYFARKL